ncbi:MAG: hypothetical protein IJY52_03040, partial [Anaerotignum sp.]|nr:hypothetical protein [Anaerotignum sp.]
GSDEIYRGWSGLLSDIDKEFPYATIFFRNRIVFIGGLAVGTAKLEKMSSALGYFTNSRALFLA